jgi:hypothetical protein
MWTAVVKWPTVIVRVRWPGGCGEGGGRGGSEGAQADMRGLVTSSPGCSSPRGAVEQRARRADGRRCSSRVARRAPGPAQPVIVAVGGAAGRLGDPAPSGSSSRRRWPRRARGDGRRTRSADRRAVAGAQAGRDPGEARGTGRRPSRPGRLTEPDGPPRSQVAPDSDQPRSAGAPALAPARWPPPRTARDALRRRQSPPGSARGPASRRRTGSASRSPGPAIAAVGSPLMPTPTRRSPARRPCGPRSPSGCS